MASLEEQIDALQHLLAECNNEKRQLRERNSRNQDVWNQEDESHRVDINRLNVRVSDQERRLEEVGERENHLRDQLREAIRLQEEENARMVQLEREITRLGTSEGVALHRLIAAQEENIDLQEQIRASEEQLASLLRNPVAATPVAELEAVATVVPPLQEATAHAVESVSLPDVPTHDIVMDENLNIPFGATAEEARARIMARAARRRARPQSPTSPQGSGRMGGLRKRRKKRTRKKRKSRKKRTRKKRKRKKTRRRRKRKRRRKRTKKN